ncbi:MAG: hypothetical protein IPO23_06800 [Flavobacterium sp.]|nr:hypothetical protein [Flavobacterium sp.]
MTFIPVQQANADFGFTKNHFWIKFQLKNDSDAEVLYFLETARPITDFANSIASPQMVLLPNTRVETLFPIRNEASITGKLFSK